MSTIKTPPPPLDELRRSALTERIKEQNRVIRRNRDVIARQRLGATGIAKLGVVYPRVAPKARRQILHAVGAGLDAVRPPTTASAPTRRRILQAAGSAGAGAVAAADHHEGELDPDSHQWISAVEVHRANALEQQLRQVRKAYRVGRNAPRDAAATAEAVGFQRPRSQTRAPMRAADYYVRRLTARSDPLESARRRIRRQRKRGDDPRPDAKQLAALGLPEPFFNLLKHTYRLTSPANRIQRVAFECWDTTIAYLRERSAHASAATCCAHYVALLEECLCEWIDGGVGFDEIPSEFIRRLADAYLLRIHIAWKHPRLDRRATRCAQYALALYRGLYGATSEHVGSCLTLWQRTSLRLADEQPAPSFAVRERLTRYELVVADWIMRCRMLRREPWQFIANLVQCVAAAEREIRMLAGAFPAPAALFAPLLSRRSSSANTDGKSSTSPSTSEPASEAALREKQPSGRSGPTGEASLRDAASARRLAAAVAVCRLAKRLLWRGFVGAGRLVRAGREQRVTVRGQTLDAWIDWVITDAPTGAAWLKTGDVAVLQALADAERHVDGRALTDPVRLPKLAALRFSTGCVHSRARRWRAALGPLRFAFALMVHIPPRAWTRAGVARIAETGARLIEALYAVRSHDAARDVALRASLYVFWPLPSSATIQQLKARAELLATGSGATATGFANASADEATCALWQYRLATYIGAVTWMRSRAPRAAVVVDATLEARSSSSSSSPPSSSPITADAKERADQKFDAERAVRLCVSYDDRDSPVFQAWVRIRTQRHRAQIQQQQLVPDIAPPPLLSI